VALQAYDDCGLHDSYACGYGLACVAQTITYGQCRPLCGETAPESFYTKVIAAGCTNDGQSGTVNSDASFGRDVFVGGVVEVGGVSYPECALNNNMALVGTTGAAPVQPPHYLAVSADAASALAPGAYGQVARGGYGGHQAASGPGGPQWNSGKPWAPQNGRQDPSHA
jgi:hypothetical protein